MHHLPPLPTPTPTPTPAFVSVESAWFWTMRTLRSSTSGAATLPVATVLRSLDTLYRHRRIELIHVRILRIWGLRGVAPDPARTRERSDWRLWHEAMDRLDGPLRAKGIVAGALFQDAAD